MKKLTLSLGLLLSFACLGFAQSTPELTTFENDPYGVSQFTLDNGMQVYLMEDPDMATIFGAVAIRAGGKYDPADATGMGHYLEHMLFKGTQTMGTTDYQKEKPYLDRIDSLYEVLGQTQGEEERDAVQKAINDQAVKAAEYAIPNEFDRLLSSIGSSGVNAFTTEEVIVYHNSFPPNQVAKWLDIFSHRFEKPVFRLFQSELETVYEEKNRAMDGFIFTLFTDFQKNMFKNHPYGTQTVLGTTDHLKNPSLIKMYKYFNDYYVANNMALVLSGNFKKEDVIGPIVEKFGKLKSGEVPSFKEYKEDDFEGREFFKGRYTPVKVGIMGFRTPPANHEDEAAMDVVSYILTNSNQTGSLDQLTLDKKMLAAQLDITAYNDYGVGMAIFVPKILGQRLKKTEAMMRAELSKIAEGDFDPAIISTAKLNLKKEFIQALENPVSRALFVADAFAGGWSWKDNLDYLKDLEAVGKKDVEATAQKYFGDNFLAFYSKMGFPKKNRLEKPPYAPPKPKSEGESEYAQYFKTLKEVKPQANFVDFEKDIDIQKIGDKVEVWAVDNPYNDLFRLEMKFGIGSYSIPDLEQAAKYINYLGASKQDVKELRAAFSRIGCSYSVSAKGNTTNIVLEGFSDKLAEGLALIGELMYSPINDDDKIRNLYSEEKTNRKFEAKDPATVGGAAYAYAVRGQESTFLARKPVAEIKKLKGEKLLKVWTKALDYEARVHFSGSASGAEVRDLLKTKVFHNQLPTQKRVVVDRTVKEYKEPTVYFLNRKDALQSQVYFHMAGPDFKVKDEVSRQAFNEYFGGNMSSLVFQEIREFRSLAYSTRAYVKRPLNPNKKNYLFGFIGCQGDKTLEAIEVMHGLLTDMPEKEGRTAAIQNSLVQGAYSSRPGFRNLSMVVAEWIQKGYKQDPYQKLLPQYEKVGFEDIRNYYKGHIQSNLNGLAIVITGDSRQFDLESLKKYGKVVLLDEKEILVR